MSQNFRFNPRSREGSDLSGRLYFSTIHCFNPRSREGSDKSGRNTNGRMTKFQSTLPRGERRLSPAHIDGPLHVSIHAPARGATEDVRMICQRPFVFQSTLPRGERHDFTPVFSNLSCFNPRSREGSDEAQLVKIKDYELFQSTLPRGERRCWRWKCADFYWFQSTLPRGERLARAMS